MSCCYCCTSYPKVIVAKSENIRQDSTTGSIFITVTTNCDIENCDQLRLTLCQDFVSCGYTGVVNLLINGTLFQAFTKYHNTLRVDQIKQGCTYTFGLGTEYCSAVILNPIPKTSYEFETISVVSDTTTISEDIKVEEVVEKEEE